MSEKFSSKQDRADAIDEVRDFVDVDSMGRARVLKGSGSKGGKFLSDHEVKMLEAHAGQVYDGMENRENEALLDAIGDTTDPQEIYEAMLEHGFVDEDYFLNEEEKGRNEEVLRMLAETRAEVADFYGMPTQSENMKRLDERLGGSVASGKRRADVEVDAPSQAEGYVRKQDREAGRHRAESSDESSPIFDELLASHNLSALSQEAQEGESLEEYEARHGSRHLETLPVDSLEAIVNGEHILHVAEPLPVSELEAIARGEAPEPLPTTSLDVIAADEGESLPVRSRRERIRDFFTPAGLAIELGRLSSSAAEKLGKHKKAKIGFGILAVAGTVAAVYAARHTGHSTPSGESGGSFGNFLDHLGDNASTAVNDFSDKVNDTANTRTGGSGSGHSAKELFDSSVWNIPKGSGGEALMGRLGADKSVWYEHQDEFLKLFPNDGYRMSDGNVGFDDPGRLSKGAIDFWKSVASK